MPVDQDRYNSLIARASFNMEAWRGTYQDQSANRLAMTAVGTPTWGRVNGLPCLGQGTVGTRVASAAVAGVVDMTAAFGVEVVVRPSGITDPSGILAWPAAVNSGGFWLFRDRLNGRIILYEFNGAGVQRIIYGTSTTATNNRLLHVVLCSDAAGTAGRCYTNGVPGVVALGGAGAPTNPAASAITVFGPYDGLTYILAIRTYPFALTNEDVTALYQQARALTGGEV